MNWNVWRVHDALHYAREQNIDIVVIAWDFRKAYDLCLHAWLFATIDIMCGVPLEDVWEDLQGAQKAPHGKYAYKHSSPVTKWVQLLYGGHSRTVGINGETTEWFELESSVPQGCIAAPTCFVIFAEALGILMRTNVEIKGVQLPNGEFILSCRFADDTAVVCIPASIDGHGRDLQRCGWYGE